MKRYSFTEQELLQLIKLSFDLGKGSPPDSGPITLDWPKRILRHAIHYADGTETMKDFLVQTLLEEEPKMRGPDWKIDEERK